MDAFKNEPLLDFSQADLNRRLEGLLVDALAASPRERPLIIGGERISTGRWIESRDRRNRLLRYRKIRICGRPFGRSRN